MAEKILNTRILLKYDTLANWNATETYLRKGEVAIATVASGNTQEVNSVAAPQVLIKVGDGQNKFRDLPFITAKAGDVHKWAKKENLDYNDLPKTLRDEIDALQAAVGTGGSVANQIAAAIDAAKGYVDQKVQEINGAASTLAGRVKANEDAIAVINSTDATKAGSLAKVAADAAKAVADEAKRAGDKETELAGAIATEKGRIDAFFASAEIGDKALDTLKEIQNELAKDDEGAAAMLASIQENKEAIEAEVTRATTKEGELAKAIADEATARGNKDTEHTNAINGINSKIGTVPTGKTLIGLIGENTTAIGTEKTRAEAAEASLLAKIGTVADGQNLAALIAANTKAIGDEATARDNADKQHTADIKAINDKVGTGTTTAGTTLIAAINANTTAIANEKTRAEAAEAKALSDAKAYTDAEVKELADGQVKTNTDAIAAINGNKNIVKSVEGDDVVKASIANNKLTIDFDDTLTFILKAGDSTGLDATAQG